MKTKAKTHKGKGKPELPKIKWERNQKQFVESTADFKARLAAMNPKTTEERRAENPSYRRKGDKGYRKTEVHPLDCTGAVEAAEEAGL